MARIGHRSHGTWMPVMVANESDRVMPLNQ